MPATNETLTFAGYAMITDCSIVILAYPFCFVNLAKKQINRKEHLNMLNLFYDGFNSKLIETAFFDGSLEIPILSLTKR